MNDSDSRFYSALKAEQLSLLIIAFINIVAFGYGLFKVIQAERWTTSLPAIGFFLVGAPIFRCFLWCAAFITQADTPRVSSDAHSTARSYAISRSILSLLAYLIFYLPFLSVFFLKSSEMSVFPLLALSVSATNIPIIALWFWEAVHDGSYGANTEAMLVEVKLFSLFTTLIAAYMILAGSDVYFIPCIALTLACIISYPHRYSLHFNSVLP